jgi:hypothetical protein
MRMARTISELTVLPTPQSRLRLCSADLEFNKSAENKGHYGLISIKIGNPANTGGAKPLVSFDRLWSPS